MNIDDINSQPTLGKRLFGWANLILTILLIGWGAWYLIREVTLAEIGAAMAQAKLGYIISATAIFITTVVIKAWRWQLMYYPANQAPTFKEAFWAMMTGQFINVTVPFLRLGEVARIYSLQQETGLSKMRSLGTLVVEKALDLIVLLLTLALLLPVVVISEYVSANEILLILVTAVLCLFLYLLAYRTNWFIQLLHRLIKYIPGKFGQKLSTMVVSGLDGLASLRDQRVVLILVVSSVLVGFLAILTPLALFPAFDIPLGIVAAALIHVGATVASVPATTPAKIGVVQWVVIFILGRFNIENEAVIWSYALVYHMSVMLPQIILGLIASSRSSWQWSTLRKQQLTSTNAP